MIDHAHDWWIVLGFMLYQQYFSHVTASINIIVTCCILAFILSEAFLFTEEHGNTPAELTSQLMQNPQILADLQHRLGSMVGVSSGYIQRFVYRCRSNLNAVYEEIFALFYFRSQVIWWCLLTAVSVIFVWIMLSCQF